MKVVAINGSPRKNWNTATLLKEALDGAASKGADTQLVHLYDFLYHGCTSCFGCKRKGKIEGKCKMQDELTPVLKEVLAADAVVFGSPIYYGRVTAGITACMERLLFPLTIYSREVATVLPKKKPSAFIYTMGTTEEYSEPYKSHLAFFDKSVNRLFMEKPESLFVYNTYQFSDYSKYESSMFSEQEKSAWKATQFPKDCQSAFRLGASLVS